MQRETSEQTDPDSEDSFVDVGKEFQIELEADYEQIYLMLENKEKDTGEIKLENKEILKKFYALKNEVQIMMEKVRSKLPKLLYEEIKNEATGIFNPFTESVFSHQDVDLENVRRLEKLHKKLNQFLMYVENLSPALKKKNEEISVYQSSLFCWINKIRAWLIDNAETIDDELERNLGDPIKMLRRVYQGVATKENLHVEVEVLEKLWKSLCQKKLEELQKETFQLEDESKIMLEKLKAGTEDIVPGFEERLHDILHPKTAVSLEYVLNELKKFHKDLKEVLAMAEEEDPDFEKRNREMARDESRMLDLLKIIRAYSRKNPLTKDDKEAMNEALKRAHQAFSNKERVDRAALAECIQKLEGIVKKQTYDGKTIEQWSGIVNRWPMFLPAPASRAPQSQEGASVKRNRAF